MGVKEDSCALEYFLYLLYKKGTSIDDIMYTLNKWQMNSWSQPSIAAENKIPKIKNDNIISLVDAQDKHFKSLNIDHLAFYDYGGIMIYNPEIGVIVSDETVQASFENWNKSLGSEKVNSIEKPFISTGVFYLPKIMHAPKQDGGSSKYLHLQNKYKNRGG